MKLIKRSCVAIAGVVIAFGCGDPTGADSLSLIGLWDLIGFTDDGVAAQTTGTWEFRADGTHTVSGTVTFPGEPTDDISGSGTYEQNGAAVVLVLGSESSDWTLAIADDIATLTQDEPPPANTITLRRR